jgi:hypothetical protein
MRWLPSTPLLSPPLSWLRLWLRRRMWRRLWLHRRMRLCRSGSDLCCSGTELLCSGSKLLCSGSVLCRSWWHGRPASGPGARSRAASSGSSAGRACSEAQGLILVRISGGIATLV